MKELSDFLLVSKDAFQRHKKITNQTAAKLKKSPKKNVDQIKRIAEIFIDQNSFNVPMSFRIMVTKHEVIALYL